MKLEKVMKKLEEVEVKFVKAAKHLAKNEREEMAGIIEYPARQQRQYTTLANN